MLGYFTITPMATKRRPTRANPAVTRAVTAAAAARAKASISKKMTPLSKPAYTSAMTPNEKKEALQAFRRQQALRMALLKAYRSDQGGLITKFKAPKIKRQQLKKLTEKKRLELTRRNRRMYDKMRSDLREKLQKGLALYPIMHLPTRRRVNSQGQVVPLMMGGQRMYPKRLQPTVEALEDVRRRARARYQARRHQKDPLHQFRGPPMDSKQRRMRQVDKRIQMLQARGKPLQARARNTGFITNANNSKRGPVYVPVSVQTYMQRAIERADRAAAKKKRLFFKRVTSAYKAAKQQGREPGPVLKDLYATVRRMKLAKRAAKQQNTLRATQVVGGPATRLRGADYKQVVLRRTREQTAANKKKKAAANKKRAKGAAVAPRRTTRRTTRPAPAA